MVIEGFKSYKDQTISEPFDQHINVVGEQAVILCAHHGVLLRLELHHIVDSESGLFECCLLQWELTALEKPTSSMVSHG